MLHKQCKGKNNRLVGKLERDTGPVLNLRSFVPGESGLN